MRMFAISFFVVLVNLVTLFSQDIEKEIDDFTGDTIYTLESSNLSGGSFIGLQNANLTLKYISSKTLFMKLSVTNGSVFSIKNGSLGASLYIKTDKKINELSDNGQNTFKAGQGFWLAQAVYIINFELIKEIIDSKEVKVRILTTDETYMDFHFGEDNMKEYKKFYKKFNK